jgi:RNA polymerase sigma factor (sigma-70 family)
MQMAVVLSPRIAQSRKNDSSEEHPDYKSIQAGLPEAWEQGFKILWGVGHAACHGALKNCHGVDVDLIVSDAVTEVIPKAMEVPSWDELKALTARVAWCRAIDAVRRMQAKKHGGGRLDSLQDLISEPASPKHQQPDEDLYHAEVWRAYRECTGQLNPKVREIVEYRLVDQMTQKEISEKVGTPQGTVGVMIMKTLENIRECLESRGFRPSGSLK